MLGKTLDSIGFVSQFDPEIADVTYIEPLNVDRLEQIIAKEKQEMSLKRENRKQKKNVWALIVLLRWTTSSIK